MAQYELEASGSKTFQKKYNSLSALESELRITHFPGSLSVLRIDLNEEVAFGSQSDVLEKIKLAKENGFSDLPGFNEY